MHVLFSQTMIGILLFFPSLIFSSLPPLLITGGGDLKVLSQKLEWKVSPRVGSLDNVKHKAGGGQVQIFDEKYNRASRSSSQVRSQTPASRDGDQLSFKDQSSSETPQNTDHSKSKGEDESGRGSDKSVKPEVAPKPAVRKASNGNNNSSTGTACKT